MHSEITSIPKKSRRIWPWIIGVAAVLLVAAGIGVEVALHRAAPILRQRVIETLSARFNAKVELDDIQVSVIRGLETTGGGLRIFPPDAVMEAGATHPLIAIDHFTFHTAVSGLFAKPTRIGTVYVTGLAINIPPKEARRQSPKNKRRLGKLSIVVDEIVCDNSRLIIETAKPDKEPRIFELKHIELRNVGPNEPWQYSATLTNAIPKGDIQAHGTFGPWNNDDPGSSTTTGEYTFNNADLGTIRGIGGILSSVGKFGGQLDRIVADGTTETPDFSLDIADHKLPLHTRFHAVIDGTSGNTYLESVEAKLKDSSFTCKGAVVNIKGKGEAIDLDVNVPAGKIEDFLALAVKMEQPLMTARVTVQAKLNILPGTQRVVEKLRLNGGYTLQNIHFTNPKFQDSVDMMSLRAQGEARKAVPGAEDVTSKMSGNFVIANAKLKLRDLRYTLPGGSVDLAGEYTLDGGELDFAGLVHTEAKLSQMVTTWWKSVLLKPVDPFFKKNGAGAEVPVRITGTKDAPKFGLNFRKKKKT